MLIYRDDGFSLKLAEVESALRSGGSEDIFEQVMEEGAVQPSRSGLFSVVNRSSFLQSDVFEEGVHVVYPIHGVGFLSERVSTSVGDKEVSCYKVDFESKKIVIFVPIDKVRSVGMRNLISADQVQEIYAMLKEQSRGLRVVWNRRAKEYESKIQSGCIFENAEIVRDLYRNINNPNKSYTESIIYDEALSRVVTELSVVLGKTLDQVTSDVNDILDKYHETYQEAFDDGSDDFSLDEDYDDSSSTDDEGGEEEEDEDESYEDAV